MQTPPLPGWARYALAALATAVAALAAGLIITIDDDGPDGPKPAKVITVRPAGGGTIKAKASTVAAAKADALKANAADPDKAAGEPEVAGAKRETISPATREKQSTQAKRGTTGPDSPTPIAQGASFSQPGCRTIPVANYSSRGSQRPGLGVAHYTVSKNRAGWGDVLAIASLFNNPRYQASSNYVIDREGHCAYIVSEAAKAWTQGNMNGASACSVEGIGDASENPYVGAGLAKAAAVFRSCFKRWGIPVRLGATSGCSITRTGLVDHNELACGNNHTDIKPFQVMVIVNAMANGAAANVSAKASLTKVQRQIVDRRCFHYRKRFARGASAATRAKQLRYSRLWKGKAGREKGRLTARHRAGVSWRTGHLGVQRKRMAQTERFARADRRAVCHG